MARKLRGDVVGAIFHVFNRGRRKQPIFLEPQDFRYFLSRVAYAVRRGEIEVLGFVLLSNHFHLVVRSCGGLSEAMRRIENEYARYFNSRYADEGMLCRSRFESKRVTDAYYLRNLLLYCDENPRKTTRKLATLTQAYEWSSAYRFARTAPTPWLNPVGIESVGIRYGAAAPAPSSPQIRRVRRWFIHSRMRAGSDGVEAFGDLLSGDPDRILAWFLKQTASPARRPACLPAAGRWIIQKELAGLEASVRDLKIDLGGRWARPAHELLEVGLLRDLAALSFPRITKICGRSTSTTQRTYERHARAIREVPEYRKIAIRLVEACVAPLRM